MFRRCGSGVLGRSRTLFNSYLRRSCRLTRTRAANAFLGCKTGQVGYVGVCRLAYTFGCAMHSRDCGATSDGGHVDPSCAIEVADCAAQRLGS